MLHTIHNSHLTVTVAEKGAELQSLQDNSKTEYLWQGDQRYWTDRAPNLFPFIGRLTEGKYYLDGALYEMPIHGIAPYADFRAVEEDSSSVTLELTDEEWYLKYPRHFALRIRYYLDQNKLFITNEVENRDEKVLYFGIGGHPGFRIPVRPELSFEDYRLSFPDSPKARRILFTEDCFLTGTDEAFHLEDGRFLPLSHDLFDKDAIVLKNIQRKVTIETKTKDPVITLDFPDFPYLGIWHWPKTDAPYVCLEPWSSLPAAKGGITVFEEKKDLLHLLPGNTWKSTWIIEVHGAKEESK